MKILLLSGGSGKRLWPLSNQARPKQFLKLLRSEDGQVESMIQRVCRQLGSAGLLSSTHIITCQSQNEVITNQIGDQIPILLEPEQRGTFPSISLAASYLYSELQIDPEEIICVLPVDSFVELDFFHLLRTIPDILLQSQADLALLGAAAKFPSNQYGYILPEIKESNNYYSIHQFVEKPNQERAGKLIHNGALWNCGVFAFSLQFMVSFLKDKKLPTDYNQFLAKYDQIAENSFDYEVAEKTPNSVVIPYDGVWKDVGSWDALSKQVDSHVLGSGQISIDSTNTHMINELSIPIHVIGIPNSIIAAGPDGILIADKRKASKIKEFVKNKRPMYEEKRWGSCKVLEVSTTSEGGETITKTIKLLPGKNTSYHTHSYREKIWTILSGSGEMILNDQHLAVKAGDVVKIPQGTKHGVKAETQLEFIEVQLGSPILEEDLNRITYSWDEAIKRCQ
ncbi:mannose-1-phosphate guanylyltransferase [Peribacillus deserti]|uniref:Mannose-1-phosphate guanylyltransferase n=1 Tax=Peribacillus deserti TaxID=673318 RepID=A0ABS2QEB1_9BACI|nr:sugar phosphate nucleotidyltransferase [Peribacillus deserti]MBM7691479.1 mannose-1-phosphate guanylyltransferase [Peribacillus deserti]